MISIQHVTAQSTGSPIAPFIMGDDGDREQHTHRQAGECRLVIGEEAEGAGPGSPGRLQPTIQDPKQIV